MPDAEAVRERRVNLARLDRELALGQGVQRLCSAHFLQLLGQSHDDQAHIADDSEQHLAQRLRMAAVEPALRCPVRRHPEMPELIKFPGESSGLHAEALNRALRVKRL